MTLILKKLALIFKIVPIVAAYADVYSRFVSQHPMQQALVVWVYRRRWYSGGLWPERIKS
jgi:hypothetical protein